MTAPGTQTPDPPHGTALALRLDRALSTILGVAISLTLAPPAALAAARAPGRWERLEGSAYGRRYEDLHFISPGEGWAVNGFGQIWHTRDAGESWALQYDDDHLYFRSIEFATAELGWAGTITSTEPLFWTRNGGETWEPASDLPAFPRPVAICGIHVVSETVMFATGVWSGPGHILRTLDAGRSYTSFVVPDSMAVGLIDVYFENSMAGYVVGGVGPDLFTGRPVILRTLDGGESWTTHFVGSIEGAWCWKIAFPTPEVGYVSVERIEGPHYFLKSTDGGESWVEMPFEGGARSQGIGFVTPQVGWIGGPPAVNPTFITLDGGRSWAVDSFGANLNRFQFFGSDLGYGAGDYIYRFTNDNDFDSIDIIDAIHVPPSSRPPQSFPNPMRAMTTIRYTLNEAAGVRLFVSDTGGRLLRTLVHGRMPAGVHRITWDGKDDDGDELPLGLYLYVIRSEALNAIGKLVKVE